MDIWAYTLVGPSVRGLVLDPLAVYTSTTVYIFTEAKLLWDYLFSAVNPKREYIPINERVTAGAKFLERRQGPVTDPVGRNVTPSFCHSKSSCRHGTLEIGKKGFSSGRRLFDVDDKHSGRAYVRPPTIHTTSRILSVIRPSTLNLESRCIPVVGGGVFVSRTQLNH